jgi:hypothetical protein
MIKVEHTIIAYVTVTCPLRPENHARLAEFKLKYLWRSRIRRNLGYIQKLNSLSLGQDIAIPRMYCHLF